MWPRGEQYRDVPSRRDEGPKPEERKKRLRHSGGLFFCVLFFGQAKKSTPTAIREPQKNYLIDGNRADRRDHYPSATIGSM
jgi:hypothetical protein